MSPTGDCQTCRHATPDDRCARWPEARRWGLRYLLPDLVTRKPGAPGCPVSEPDNSVPAEGWRRIEA